MILLNKEQIKHLHGKLIQETGGIDGKNWDLHNVGIFRTEWDGDRM